MRTLRLFVVLTMIATSAAAIDRSDPRVAKLALPERTAATPSAAKTVTVDCTKGESIQEAVDKNAGPLAIEIRGFCSENVRVAHHDDVTLRGSDPANDGIHGVASTPVAPALAFRHSDRGRVENLSVSNGPAGGISFVYSPSDLFHCRITGNASNGLSVIWSVVHGTELTISDNQGIGLQAAQGTFVSCLGCLLENNMGFAAAYANWGGALTLWDSVVTGTRGILATNGAYADIDCLTQVSSHPCSMNVTGFAARAVGNANAALYVAGDFTGQVSAFDRGQIQIIGSRQLATGQPGIGPTVNRIDGFSTMTVEPLADENGIEQKSRVMSTNVTNFGRALLVEESVLNGSIQCSGAGDAWLDETVVANPGSTVTGCEHASVP